MKRSEVRHKLISALLQAEGPVPRSELFRQSDVPRKVAAAVLAELVRQGRAVEGQLVPGDDGVQVRWAARWAEETRARGARARRKLDEIINPPEKLSGARLAIDSEHVASFHDYVIHDYVPPADKRLLAFFQCSVRRPFSKSPSHGSMRRAVAVATGYDPARDFGACPVHVVVLASTVGPVPYELEDVYPVNVRSGGVKHLRPEQYETVKPILSGRVAEYLRAHRDRYDHVASFTDAQYGEVMAEAQQAANTDFPIFPQADGPRVVRMGESLPRTYWQKFWIQLYLEIVSWLPRPAREDAAQRLKALDVVYR